MAENPDDQGMALLYTEVLMKRGEDRKALDLLSHWRTKDPQSLPFIQLTVSLLSKQNQLDEALALCNEFVETSGEGAAYLLRAKVWMGLKEKEQVLADFERAIRLDPDNARNYADRARYLQEQGDYSSAIRDMEKALELRSEDMQAVVQAINLYMTSGEKKHYERGRTLLDTCLQEYPNNSHLLFMKAQELLVRNNRRDAEEAIKYLQVIIEQDPDIAVTWTVLGNVYLEQGRPEDALQVALRGLAKFPQNKGLYHIKAEAEAVHAPSFAISTLHTVRELDPADTQVVLRLVDLYRGKKKYDLAQTLLAEELADCTDPDKRQRLVLAQVWVLYMAGQREQAVTSLAPYMDRLYQDPSVFLTHAEMILKESNWDELLALIRQWCQANPLHLNVANRLANLMIWHSDSQAHETAQKALEIILEADPENLMALADLATHHERQERIKQAIRVQKQILEIDSENKMAMNNLAWLLSKYQKEYQTALAWAEKGLEIDPEYADLIDTRGVIYNRLGEFELATADFRRCLELYPRF